FWLGFSFHRNQIKFEKGKFFLGLFRSPRSEDNRNTVIFGLALQAGSDVDRIAENRIVEAQVGSEIADNAAAGVETDADAKWQERLPGARSLLLTLPIEHLHVVQHRQRGRAGTEFMVWNI